LRPEGILGSYEAKECGGETFGEPTADVGADLDMFLLGGGII
jgi:hypothetical protein